MIERLEYFTGGIDIGNAVVWVRHPNLDDVVDKINELIDTINEMARREDDATD